MLDMEQKWSEIKKKLDGMSNEEFEEMIKRNGHYDIKFAEDSLYVKAMNMEDGMVYHEKENRYNSFDTENVFSESEKREVAA